MVQRMTKGGADLLETGAQLRNVYPGPAEKWLQNFPFWGKIRQIQKRR